MTEDKKPQAEKVDEKPKYKVGDIVEYRFAGTDYSSRIKIIHPETDLKFLVYETELGHQMRELEIEKKNEKKKVGAPEGNKNALGNEGGRPTKWNSDDHDSDTLSKTREYIESCIDEDNGNVKIVKLPSLQGLAAFLGVGTSTLDNWVLKTEDTPLKEEERIEFLGTLNKLKGIQGERLINKGLSGDYNPTIAKLLLMNNHDMAEKSKEEHNLTGDVSITQMFHDSQK